MTFAQSRALYLIGPYGATVHILEQNGVARETLDGLQRAGLVRCKDQRYANPRGLVVRWYYRTTE